ncbi:MAG: hypothetical protein DSY47_01175 [Hydrogenothermus sp.]|nr:MAG: hypothetical protein DSY47_01175 [Hydrogenothermus sp.]
MKNKEIVKFIAETLRNIGVGFVIANVVLFLSTQIKTINSIFLFLLGTYNILFGIYLFVLYVKGGNE